MFSKELESLIQATLQDGVLTEQEKAVLIRRAQNEGVDLDELDIYIQSLLQKRHQEEAEKEAEEDRASKIGDVRRCAGCGYNVPSGFAACPNCGQTFNVTETTGSWAKLQDALANMKEKTFQTKEFGDLPDYDELGSRKDEIVINFPVPNTRADLLEFLSSLQPKAKNKKRSLLQTGAEARLASPYAYWQLYCNCINKARVSFADDASFKFFFNYYEEEKNRKGFLGGLFSKILGK